MVSARRHRIAAIGPLLLTLLASSVLVATPARASAVGDFLSMTNASRAAAGLSAYSVSSELVAVAQNWANHMASTGVLAHNPSYSKQIANWQFVGENVGVGPDAKSIQDAFMNSPKHRDNILDRDFTQVGIATATAFNGDCQCDILYVAVNFRMPKSTPAPPVKPAPAQPPVAKPAAPAAPKAPATTAATQKAAASTAKPATPKASTPKSSSSKPASPPPAKRPDSPASATPDPVQSPVQSPTPSASALATQLATAAGQQATAGRPDPVSRALDFTAVMGLLSP